LDVLIKRRDEFEGVVWEFDVGDAWAPQPERTSRHFVLLFWGAKSAILCRLIKGVKISGIGISKCWNSIIHAPYLSIHIQALRSQTFLYTKFVEA
jgi:hypothetical protein